MNLSLGTRLGVYDIAAPIGKGRIGQVYRARDTGWRVLAETTGATWRAGAPAKFFAAAP